MFHSASEYQTLYSYLQRVNLQLRKYTVSKQTVHSRNISNFEKEPYIKRALKIYLNCTLKIYLKIYLKSI